ncbi:MAG: ParA family protein [Chloroflexota bacterium]
MPYTIAISNEKGGVAKTTSTYSLGAALVESGKKVLLIDLDPQANLTLANGIEPGKSKKTSADILLDDLNLLDAIQKTNTANLFIIPSSPRIADAEKFLPTRNNYTSKLRKAIGINNDNFDFDFLLMDCPPSMGVITMNALTAANLLIIPTQAEYFSAYALRDMMALIRKIRKESNPALAYRILITMLDQRNRTHRTIWEQLKQTFGIGLFDAVIEIDTRLRESPIIGMPISKYRPSSRGSIQYDMLAKELIAYLRL